MKFILFDLAHQDELIGKYFIDFGLIRELISHFNRKSLKNFVINYLLDFENQFYVMQSFSIL